MSAIPHQTHQDALIVIQPLTPKPARETPVRNCVSALWAFSTWASPLNTLDGIDVGITDPGGAQFAIQKIMGSGEQRRAFSD
jgi:hypothetical protein